MVENYKKVAIAGGRSDRRGASGFASQGYRRAYDFCPEFAPRHERPQERGGLYREERALKTMQRGRSILPDFQNC